jgi:hypothetical protein
LTPPKGGITPVLCVGPLDVLDVVVVVVVVVVVEVVVERVVVLILVLEVEVGPVEVTDVGVKGGLAFSTKVTKYDWTIPRVEARERVAGTM